MLAEIFGSEAHFGPIYMGSDVAHDGIEYVTAHAIYESADESLDVNKLMAAIEPLRDRVRALGESAIPVLSYVAKSEEREWLGDRPQLV